MSKDYGSRRRQTRKKSTLPGSLLTIASSFLCGYLVASLYDISSLTDWIMKNVINHKDSGARIEVKVNPPVKVKPKFEFYTLLSKENSGPQPTRPTPPIKPVPTAKMEALHVQAGVVQKQANVQANSQVHPSVPVSDSKSIKSDTPSAKEIYQIQLAAFNKREDAEHMKASLVLSGFDASITSISQNNVTWFRVIVGPFMSLPAAEKVQMKMVRIEHVKGMIRRVTQS